MARTRITAPTAASRSCPASPAPEARRDRRVGRRDWLGHDPTLATATNATADRRHGCGTAVIAVLDERREHAPGRSVSRAEEAGVRAVDQDRARDRRRAAAARCVAQRARDRARVGHLDVGDPVTRRALPQRDPRREVRGHTRHRCGRRSGRREGVGAAWVSGSVSGSAGGSGSRSASVRAESGRRAGTPEPQRSATRSAATIDASPRDGSPATARRRTTRTRSARRGRRARLATSSHSWRMRSTRVGSITQPPTSFGLDSRPREAPRPSCRARGRPRHTGRLRWRS